MQIREELNYHSIRLYPFDTEENDDEERQLNESIRDPGVCTDAVGTDQDSFLW